MLEAILQLFGLYSRIGQTPVQYLLKLFDITTWLWFTNQAREKNQGEALDFLYDCVIYTFIISIIAVVLFLYFESRETIRRSQSLERMQTELSYQQVYRTESAMRIAALENEIQNLIFESEVLLRNNQDDQ